MTPEEHSEFLIKKFSTLNEWVGGQGYISLGREMGKQCAIMCVEQIIPCTWKWDTYKKNGYISVDEQTTTEYWEEVLQILKNS